MEHPVFSLDKARYDRGDTSAEETGSKFPLHATGRRRSTTDVLIYRISQCMAALNDGRKVQRTMRFKAYDLLVATNPRHQVAAMSF